MELTGQETIQLLMLLGVGLGCVIVNEGFLLWILHHVECLFLVALAVVVVCLFCWFNRTFYGE